MALSYVEYQGDGVTQQFPFSFEGQDAGYFDPSHITVKVDGTEVDYTLLSSNTLQISYIPSAGSSVRIERTVPKDLPYADFSRGNNFGQEVMNRSFLQQLYLMQEILDGRLPDGYTFQTAVEFLKDVTLSGDVSIPNSDPGNPEGAVTYEQADARYVNVVGDTVLGSLKVQRATQPTEAAQLLQVNEENTAIRSEINAAKQASAAGDANLQAQLTGNVPLEASAFSPISWHDQSIQNSVDIPAGVNAWSFGPTVTLEPGADVSLGEGSYWTIADGKDVEVDDTITDDDGNSKVIEDWVNGIIYDFPNLAAAKAADWEVGSRLSTGGYTTEGDGGANHYKVVPGGTGLADDGLFADMDNGNQLQGMFLNAELDPRQFGASSADEDFKPYLDRMELAASATGLRIRIDQLYKLRTSKQVVHEINFGGNGAIEVDPGISLLLSGQRSLNMNDYLPPAGYFSDSADQMRGPIRRLFLNQVGRPVLDLGGRVITVESPLDFAEITGLTQYGFPARIQNGVINIGQGFPASTSVLQATTSTVGSTYIDVEDSSVINVGDRVTSSNAYPIDTFVRSIESPTRVRLNREAFGAITNGTTRFRTIPFAFDFSNMGSTNRLSFLTFDNVEFRCNGVGSAVRLPEYFQGVWFRNCMFNDPEYYGILKTNNGNSLDLQVFGSHFYSTGFNDNPADRKAIAISYQGGDAHIVGNVMAYFKHSIVLGSGGYIIANNHPYQGNEADNSAPLEPCIVFTKSGGTAAITGNYFDNSFIRLSNQDDTNDTTPLGRMTITGNRWVQKASDPAFGFIELEIWRDSSKALHDLTVTGNWFLSLNGVVNCTKVTPKLGGALNYLDVEELHFNNNTYKNVRKVENPVVVESSVSAQSNDLVDFSGEFPFNLRVGRIEGVVPRVDSAQPFRVSTINQAANTAQVTYGASVTGSTIVTGRCDFQA